MTHPTFPWLAAVIPTEGFRDYVATSDAGMRWTKTTEFHSPEPRSGGSAVSTEREPRVKWKIILSRVAGVAGTPRL